MGHVLQSHPVSGTQPGLAFIWIHGKVEDIARLVFRAANHNTVAPAIRTEAHAVRLDRMQIFQKALLGLRPNHGIAVAPEPHGFHDPVDQIKASHVGVRLNVHLPGQFVMDPHIAPVGVLHQVDGHARHQAGQHIHTGQNLGVPAQITIALTAKHIIGIRRTKPDGALIPGSRAALGGGTGPGLDFCGTQSNHSSAS